MGHAYIGPREVRRVRMVGRGERTFLLIVLSIWVLRRLTATEERGRRGRMQISINNDRAEELEEKSFVFLLVFQST